MRIDGELCDRIDARDRGLLYGDGLFETIAVENGEPLLWDRHLERLSDGCRRLGLPAPDADRLQRDAAAEIAQDSSGVLKIIVTRGPGGRGYRPPATPVPTRILAFHPVPEHPASCWRDGIKARMCHIRLGENPALAGLKHLNRLEQVLARAEWTHPGVAEGLMRSASGNLVEGVMSNLFLVEGSQLATPDLTRCGVAGVMRQMVLDLAAELGIPCRVTDVPLQRLQQADALFLTNSLIGIWPVRQVDGLPYAIDRIPVRLRELIALHALVPPSVLF